jgi:hypothetical protein
MVVIYALHSQGPRFVESHICQNRADVGHPSSVRLYGLAQPFR